MKKSTLKGILIAVVVIALIAGAIAVASVIEHRSEKAPDGAGTSTFAQTPATSGPAQTLGPGGAAGPVDYESQAQETIQIDGRSYVPNENISTLLLIGVDDMEMQEYDTYRNQAMADFLVLAVFDSEQKTCKLLQINRNTMTDVPMLGATGDYIGLTTEQIAFAHSYGDGLEESCENTAAAVSRLLYGVQIDNYLSLNMGGITALNDAVGGVTVTIEDDFTGADDTLVQGQTVTLMGEHAFHYVHDRYGLEDDRNASRMRRQATYMTALVDKLRQKLAEDDAFILELYNAVADYLLTDCDINELSQISQDLSVYTLDGIVTPEGETVQGEFAEFYPDEDSLQHMVAELFYIPAEETAPAVDADMINTSDAKETETDAERE